MELTLISIKVLYLRTCWKFVAFKSDVCGEACSLHYGQYECCYFEYLQ